MRSLSVSSCLLVLLQIFNASGLVAETSEPVTTTLTPEQLAEYAEVEDAIRNLITEALELASMNLGYQYGSASPAQGGMDCSGTIHYLLKDRANLPDVPRQANHFYRWVWQKSEFYAVNSLKPDSFEWKHLQPGDLLFWSGTYDIDRDPPVTHVMLYLGTLKETGERIMFGASSGRRFQKVAQHGVSVFTLQLPRKGSKSRFLGYGPIPGIIPAKQPPLGVED